MDWINHQSDFIEACIIVHGNYYNYSKVIYKNQKTKIKIICPIHGEFEQLPDDHLNGCGCPKCAGNLKFTQEEFFEKANRIHGNNYNFSQFEYKGYYEKGKVICNKCGKTFYISAGNFLNGKGCSECNNKEAGKRRRLEIDKFIEFSRKVHGDKYDYSKVKYINSITKVEIICPIHGPFFQIPTNHIYNEQGCPICSSSKGERQIAKYLEEKGIKFEQQKTFEGCIYKKPLRFDFYLPDYNLIIEYNGIQHYEDIFKDPIEFNNVKNRDKYKKDFCRKNGINLLVIKYTENIKNKINSLINL